MSNNTRSIPLDTSQIIAQVAGQTGWIIFNQPEKRNAMSLQMWKALGDAALALEEDPDVRVVIMRGAGGKAFVSGDDVSEFQALRETVQQKEHYSAVVRRAYRCLSQMNKPLIAFTEGACIGAGLVIALMADMRIAVPDARFGIPAAKVGVGCEYEGVALLARLVGPSVTKDIFFSGRYMDCAQALHVGLINETISAVDVDAALRAYIARLLANAPLTMRCVKHAVRIYEEYSQTDRRDEVSGMSAACFDSHDYREGIQAFLEKRSPVFQGC